MKRKKRKKIVTPPVAVEVEVLEVRVPGAVVDALQLDDRGMREAMRLDVVSRVRRGLGEQWIISGDRDAIFSLMDTARSRAEQAGSYASEPPQWTRALFALAARIEALTDWSGEREAIARCAREREEERKTVGNIAWYKGGGDALVKYETSDKVPVVALVFRCSLEEALSLTRQRLENRSTVLAAFLKARDGATRWMTRRLSSHVWESPAPGEVEMIESMPTHRPPEN